MLKRLGTPGLGSGLAAPSSPGFYNRMFVIQKFLVYGV